MEIRPWHVLLGVIAFVAISLMAKAMPVQISSGFTGEATFSPAAVEAGGTTTLKIVFINGNVMTTTQSSVPIVLPTATGNVTLTAPLTVTSGAWLNKQLTITLPPDLSYVPSTYKVNDVLQADPTNASGVLSMVVNIPGKTAIPDASKVTTLTLNLKASGTNVAGLGVNFAMLRDATGGATFAALPTVKPQPAQTGMVPGERTTPAL